MTAKKTAKTRYIYRSAITGKVVTRAFAIANPTTTVRERVKVKPKAVKRACND